MDMKHSRDHRKQPVPLAYRKRPKMQRRHNVIGFVPAPDLSNTAENSEVISILHKLQITGDDRRRLEVRRELEMAHERIGEVSSCSWVQLFELVN